MSELNSRENLELHLESWRWAGVEFLPRLAPLPIAPPQPAPAVAHPSRAQEVSSPPSAIAAPRPVAPPAAAAPATPPPFVTTLPPVNLFGESAFSPSSPPKPVAKAVSSEPSILELPLVEPRIREKALSDLAFKVSQCKLCPELVRNRSKTVFGVGPVDVELAVVGEAPGANEDQQGEPFVGPAGQLLDRMLAACGFKREDVFICNILRCRPPNNRPPLPDEAHNCRPFLTKTLELVRPKHICLMGASAAKYLLQVEKTIGALRGMTLEWRGIPATATYHPSYLLRTPAKKAEAWQDLQGMLKRMGRPIPGK